MENNEDVKFSESEILEILQKRLIKGDSFKALCSDLEIDDMAMYSYIHKLKNLNLNVSVSNISDDIFLRISNSPDYSKENFYSINGVDETAKIGFLSD